MSGYFDPHTEAQMLGFSTGRRQGTQEGYANGHADGYEQGHADGWNEAIEKGNTEMLRQMEFTREHIAEKERLAKQLEQQRQLIAQLTERLAAASKEAAALKEANCVLPEAVSTFEKSNQQLDSSLDTMKARLDERTKQYHEEVRQFNRNVVFMKTVRSVLEDLMSEGGPLEAEIRRKFVEEYTANVSLALSKGDINIPLDQDEAFARSLPRTQQFIIDMLRSVQA